MLPKIPRWMRLAGAVGVVAFGALQLVQPTIEARPARNEMAMPPDVASVLRASCFACHSNETHLAWFDHVAPGSWLVARDVRRARAVLNFSEIGASSPGEQRAKLFEAIEMASSGVMPPSQYRALHRGAAVSESGLERLRAFARTLAASPLQGRVAQISFEGLPKDPAPAPNGMRLPRDVASWAPVEISERWDNGTERLVLANPAAFEAVKSDRWSRWPEGASLAKVAWKPGDGATPSSFVQIELMEKHGSEWRWARWVGSSLVPYGHDASFADECRRCHEPMRSRDLVYSSPQASFDPGWGAVTSVAVEKGSFHAVTKAPDGKVRAIVWAQHEDANWFGARISAGAPSVEGER
jgi:hypothetical protein